MVTLQAAIAALALSGIGQTVLLDFYSDSCVPCRQMSPTVQALIDAGYPVERVNVDKNRPLAAKFGVHSWPCFVMVVDGREVDRAVGMTSRQRLEQMCNEGVSAAPNSRSAPMLAQNNALPPQPMPPSASWPPSSSSPNSLNEPWNPSIPSQPIAAPLKPAAVSDAALLAASVRLRIADPDGRSWDVGSGTIVHSRGDEALVLTCGHVFRDSQGKGRIIVELFGVGSSEPQQVEGRLVSFDLTRDVGLVAIRTPGPVAVARLAPPDFRITAGMPVASVGCNNGDPPTVRRSQVTSLDKYQGPPNLEVAGQPVQGRSGGGLFSSDGYVIGVCNAADPSLKEGVFAAPGSIYAELDRIDYAFVYKSPSGDLRGVSAGDSPVAPPMPGPSGATDLASLNAPTSAAPSSAVVATTATEPAVGLAPHEQAALDEIHRREKEGAEIVIIVRPRGNSEAKSDVIVLDHASPQLIRQLSADGRRQDQPYPTSLALPNRKVLLEWSRPAGAR